MKSNDFELPGTVAIPLDRARPVTSFYCRNDPGLKSSVLVLLAK